ncbi:hypothetical protein ACIGXM_27035 [Kitasatospora sp. NPDC052896]|uniref:hypothetical protein n=1 Tax=Kitasatospora sp. NPDC052896 TaxID=3364061 RepID=UPI0037C561E7
MSSRHVRAIAAKLVARLPEIPRPWDVEALCAALAGSRGRSLSLHPVELPGLPFGMWFDDGAGDHILYRSSAVGYHRDHIVLHEICHLLAGHGTTPAELRSPTDQEGPTAAGLGPRAACNGTEEELAEAFATMVLKIAGQQRPKRVSAVERRAEELLGVIGA